MSDDVRVLHSRLVAISRGELDDRTISPAEAELLAGVLEHHDEALRRSSGVRYVDPCDCGHDHTTGRDGVCGPFTCRRRVWREPASEASAPRPSAAQPKNVKSGGGRYGETR